MVLLLLLLLAGLVIVARVMASRLRLTLLVLRVLVDLLLLAAARRSGVITTTITRVIGIMIASADADRLARRQREPRITGFDNRRPLHTWERGNESHHQFKVCYKGAIYVGGCWSVCLPALIASIKESNAQSHSRGTSRWW